MFCPSCGKENGQGLAYCRFCGQALTLAPGAAPGAQAPQPAPAPYPRQTLPVRQKSNSARIAVIVVAAALLIGAGAWVATKISSESPEKRIARLMREASGAQPVHNSFFSSDRQLDDNLREQFRNIFRVNQEFMERTKQIDMNEIGKVGTPQSFVDRQYAVEGIKQVHASYEMDKELEHRLSEIANNIRQTFASTHWSAAQRQAALRGFDQGFANAMEKRKRLINAERAYVEATDDIYNYATDHHADFQLVNGQLVINDPIVVQNFNAKIGQYNAHRGELLKAKADFDRFQSETLRNMGVTPKDAGLQ